MDLLKQRLELQAYHWVLIATGALIVGIADLTLQPDLWLLLGNVLFFVGFGRIVIALRG